jgi:hypothetical protein
MTRLTAGVLASIGLLLMAVGVIAVLAVGLPAVGLNRYGSNPLQFTLGGLTFGCTLYCIGAACSLIGGRRIRERATGQARRSLVAVWALPLAVACGLIAFMATRANWTGILMLSFAAVAIGTPLLLALRRTA